MVGSRAAILCDLLNYKVGRLKRHVISNTTCIVGAYKGIKTISEEMKELFLRAIHNLDISQLKFFRFMSLLKNKYLYSSEQYKRPTKSISSYIVFEHDDKFRFGSILDFVSVTKCSCKNVLQCNCANVKYYCIVRECSLQRTFDTQINGQNISHIYKIINEIIGRQLIEINQIYCLCYYVKLFDKNVAYLSIPINDMEFE